MKILFAVIQIGFCLPPFSDLSKLIENYQTLVRFSTVNRIITYLLYKNPVIGSLYKLFTLYYIESIIII